MRSSWSRACCIRSLKRWPRLSASASLAALSGGGEPVGALASLLGALTTNFALYRLTGQRLDYWDPNVFLAALSSGLRLVIVSLLTVPGQPPPSIRSSAGWTRPVMTEAYRPLILVRLPSASRCSRTGGERFARISAGLPGWLMVLVLVGATAIYWPCDSRLTNRRAKASAGRLRRHRCRLWPSSIRSDCHALRVRDIFRGVFILREVTRSSAVGRSSCALVLSPGATSVHTRPGCRGADAPLPRSRIASSFRHPSPREWRTRAAVREHILASAGLVPMPERTPLNAVVFDERAHDDYAVSRCTRKPSRVSGHGQSLQAPRQRAVPAIVSAHGHWNYRRLEQRRRVRPGPRHNLARQGFVVFTYDMIGYNDSRWYPHTPSHTFHDREFGGKRETWGLSLAGLQLWNSIAPSTFSNRSPRSRDRIGATGAPEVGRRPSCWQPSTTASRRPLR